MTIVDLRSDVEAIARPEGRMVGSGGHARACAYLERRLTEIGLQPYRGDDLLHAYRNIRAGAESYNLVGVVPGSDRQLAPVLIGAHYDSVIAAPRSLPSVRMRSRRAVRGSSTAASMRQPAASVRRRKPPWTSYDVSTTRRQSRNPRSPAPVPHASESGRSSRPRNASHASALLMNSGTRVR